MHVSVGGTGVTEPTGRMGSPKVGNVTLGEVPAAGAGSVLGVVPKDESRLKPKRLASSVWLWSFAQAEVKTIAVRTIRKRRRFCMFLS